MPTPGSPCVDARDSASLKTSPYPQGRRKNSRHHQDIHPSRYQAFLTHWIHHCQSGSWSTLKGLFWTVTGGMVATVLPLLLRDMTIQSLHCAWRVGCYGVAMTTTVSRRHAGVWVQGCLCWYLETARAKAGA